MASQASWTQDTLEGIGSTSSRRQKPVEDIRYCRGLVLLPPGVAFFSSENLRRLWLRYNVWLLLSMISIGGGIVAFLNEYFISWLTAIHQKTINNHNPSEAIRFLMWSSWAIGCTALSCICVALSDSHAAEGTESVLVGLLRL